MAVVRAVNFDDVDRVRLEELAREVEQGGGPPDGVAATEIIVLHDRDASKALVLLFFDNEEDYMTADEVLRAMPAGDTPGTRASVTMYTVAGRGTS